MCEYCGCQESVRAIADLTAEHDVVVDLSGRARAALASGDRDLAADLARRIAAVLVAHTAVEERGVFPPLAAEFPEHVEGLQQEHRAIDRVLQEAATGVPVDPAWDERLLEVLAVLRSHVLKEQDGVFPAALSRLDPDDWDRVDAVRAEFDQMLSAPTPPAAEPQREHAAGALARQAATDSMAARRGCARDERPVDDGGRRTTLEAHLVGPSSARGRGDPA